MLVERPRDCRACRRRLGGYHPARSATGREGDADQQRIAGTGKAIPDRVERSQTNRGADGLHSRRPTFLSIRLNWDAVDGTDRHNVPLYRLGVRSEIKMPWVPNVTSQAFRSDTRRLFLVATPINANSRASDGLNPSISYPS